MADMHKSLDKSKNKMHGFEQKMAKMKKVMGGVTKTIFSLKGALVGLGLGIIARSFVDAASTAEQYRVRLEVLLGSVSEASRMFKDMSAYAAEVPHTYQEIMASATMLSGIMKGGVDEIKAWMPMIGDLAAAYGMTIQDTTSQVVRMYSAGASAADMFREKGILTMLGFQYGVKYSVDETQKMMFDAWNKTDSKFKGATDKLGKTWKGLTSMMSDRWFQVRNKVMAAGLFDMIKKGISDVIKAIDNLEKAGNLDDYAIAMANKVITSVEAIVYVFEGWLQIIHQIKAGMAWIKAEGMEKMIPGLEKERERLIKTYSTQGKSWATQLKENLLLPYHARSEALIVSAERIAQIDETIQRYKELRAESRMTVVEELEAIGKINERFKKARSWLEGLKGTPGDSSQKDDPKIIPKVPVKIELSGAEKFWNEFESYLPKVSESITDVIGDSLTDVIMGSEDAWKDLGKSISKIFANVFVDAVKKQYIKPMVDNLMDSFAGKGEGFFNKPAFGGVLGDMNYGQMVGAGAMGYGMGGVGGAGLALGGLGVASLAGFGPLGMAVSALGGGLLGGELFGDSGPTDREIMIAQQKEQQAQLLAVANEEWLNMLEGFIQGFSADMGSAISSGFMEAYQSQEYQTFIDAFKLDMGNSVVEAFNKVMMMDALKPLMNLFEPAFSKVSEYTHPDKALALGFEQYRISELEKAKAVIETERASSVIFGGRKMQTPEGLKYIPTIQEWDLASHRVANLTNPSAAISYGGQTYTGTQWSELAGQGGINIEDIVAAFPGNEDLTAYLTEMEPVFDAVTGALETVTSALGLNTEAIGSNTEAILGPVESFLRELTVGQYAPALSLEGMQAEYAKLYEKAYFDPEAFGDFASFAGSGYLDFMKAYGDYNIAHEGVVSGTQAFPWYQEALAKQAEEEQQQFNIQNEITLNNNITFEFEGQALGHVITQTAMNTEEFNTFIKTVVQNEVAQGN
ncbi:MAG TPA: hypothetical protein VMV77_11890 [Bacteroidales bacterium]|nr:hypothetical protein [Bacteroidales bacterium]